MRKTKRDLEVELLDSRTIINKQTEKIRLLEEQIAFYKANTQLMVTATISLEKINDVMAHVVGDMKHLRIRPEERR